MYDRPVGDGIDRPWSDVADETMQPVSGLISNMIPSGVGNCAIKTSMPPVFVLGVTDRFKSKNDDVVMIGTEFAFTEDQVIVNMNINTGLCLAYYANENSVYCVKYEEYTESQQSRMQNVKVHDEPDKNTIISFAVRNVNSQLDSITILCHTAVTSATGDNDAYTLKRLSYPGNNVAEVLREQETILMRIAASETGIVGLRLGTTSVHLVDYSNTMIDIHRETTLMSSENTATVAHIDPGISRLFSAVSTHHSSGRVFVLCRVKLGDDYNIYVYVVDSLNMSFLETGRKIIGHATIDDGIVRGLLDRGQVRAPTLVALHHCMHAWFR